ncbi:DUF3151 domain-containing protein [Sphaerisporangium sp. TRM90804]|uniref:DUF3151 domain-containing protein n=1 Tax=Sphaerisporangium sp. TRM90804 TaxID=3031113 RepID=UPI00244C46B1|nr:DUF3151 domain-containing protein [Sphaerisporangium sp. TRM90804]MDH2426639.1 DUF3151 domain-containing protein [Sphaerisporangium sp. TRM90804]
MDTHENLFAGPPPAHLPDTPEAREALESGAKASDVAARFPAYAAAWAILADEYFTAGHAVTSYAFARTGYHRGLDQLRRAGWKGHGPIPWEHEPNQGFLRCLHALSRAAQAIGEKDEAERCAQFLRDSSATAAKVLTSP